MKLKDLKDVTPMNKCVVIEHTNREPLLHGYLEWFTNIGLEDRNVIQIYADQNILHIMIERESEHYESRRSIRQQSR